MKILHITCIVFIISLPTYAQRTFEQLMDLGYAKYENDDCMGAIDAYTKAIALAPKNEEAHYLRGVCKSILEKNKEAILDFNEAIKLNPLYAEAYFEKAFSLYILEQHKEAIFFYTKAIEAEPDYGEAYLNRGSVRHNNEDLSGACEDWTKAESLGMNIAYDLLRDNCMQ